MGYDLKAVKASTPKAMVRDAQRIDGDGGEIIHTGGQYKKSNS